MPALGTTERTPRQPRGTYASSPSGHLRIDRSEQRDGPVVLHLSGEVDIESAPTLESILRKLENADAVGVVLDLSGVEFIDSSAICVLVQAQLRAARASRQFVLANLPANVSRVLNITGLTSRFTIA